MSGAVEGVEDARAAFYAESAVAMQRQEGDQVITVEGFLRALARLTTPPARSYADGVEDAARIVEHGYRCSTCAAIFIDTPSDTLNGGHPDNGCASPNWYRLTEEEQAAAIRLLSQGGKA